MKFLHFDKQRIAWLLVPKTASTSVKTAFLEWLAIDHCPYGDGSDQEGDAGRAPGPHKAALPYFTEGHALRLRNRGGWLFVGMVRHPLARIVSSYHDPVALLRLVNSGFQIGADGFAEAVDVICRTPDDQLDHHFGPQCQHLMRGGVWLPDHLWKFENLPSVWLEIQTLFNSRAPAPLMPPLRHERKTDHLPWRSYFTPDQRARLANRFAGELHTLAEHGVHYTIPENDDAV